jgi:hypothetical protein
VSLGAATPGKKAIRWLLLAALGVAHLISPVTNTQEERRESLAGEQAAKRAGKAEIPPGYNLRYGPVVFSVAASLRTEFTDNAVYTEVNRREDLILRPEVKLNALWPITDLNALTFAVGIGYAYYVRTDELNSDAPLISPDSELALRFFIGDFRFRVYDRVSYQESLYYWGAFSYQSGEFINVNNIGKFGRFENEAGFAVDWDLHDLVLSASYAHENFVSLYQAMNYLTRSADTLALTADFSAAPKLRYGLETEGSLLDYERPYVSDHWRASAGPFADVALSPYFSFRLGAGYEAIGLEFNPRGPNTLSDYYAYARVNHTVNQFMSYWLEAAHENRVGWNSPNMQTTGVRLGANWKLIRHVALAHYFGAGVAQEQAGYYPEDFTYYQAGFGARWPFAKRWTAALGYDYTRKDSDRRLRDYGQNRVTVGFEFRF